MNTMQMDTKDMRTVYNETMAALLRQNERLCLLGADLMSSSGSKALEREFPDRVINVGIAEANMVGIAAGLSTLGRLPVCETFAAFMAGRVYDQIRVSVAYTGLNVKFVGTDPGITAERNGGTHMAIEDTGIMRTLPAMTIIEPCDGTQLIKAFPVVFGHEGPVYIRLSRKTAYRVYDDSYQFVLGRADTLEEGSDVTIIASGLMVARALGAARRLKQRGVGARVINMHTIKPLDEAAVLKAAVDTGAIVTAENNNYLNGLGSAVCETLCENGLAIPVKRIGIRDHFGEVGTLDYLLQKFRMSDDDIFNAALEAISLKKTH